MRCLILDVTKVPMSFRMFKGQQMSRDLIVGALTTGSTLTDHSWVVGSLVCIRIARLMHELTLVVDATLEQEKMVRAL
jgi:hypothetical protein